VAPAISWGAVPAGTAEIAVALVDDSAVSDGRPFVHWVIGGLDPGEIAVVEGDVPPGALQALNFFGDVGYGGPCPPPGDDPHLYRLTAYALNQQLELADGDPATEFLDIIATLTIASTDVTGFYQR
jgi:Raf kinase inhibitor-like YbhB/YbcL family protein